MSRYRTIDLLDKRLVCRDEKFMSANEIVEELKDLEQRLSEAEAKLTETENGLRWACDVYIVNDYYSGELRKEHLERGIKYVMERANKHVNG